MVKSKIYRNIFYLISLKNSSKLKITYYPVFKNRLFFDNDFRAVNYLFANSRFKVFPTFYKVGCFVTGRSRGVLSNFVMSRLTFKKYAMSGDIPGFFMSHW
jgi:ribosomal protein S14